MLSLQKMKIWIISNNINIFKGGATLIFFWSEEKEGLESGKNYRNDGRKIWPIYRVWIPYASYGVDAQKMAVKTKVKYILTLRTRTNDTSRDTLQYSFLKYHFILRLLYHLIYVLIDRTDKTLIFNKSLFRLDTSQILKISATACICRVSHV